MYGDFQAFSIPKDFQLSNSCMEPLKLSNLTWMDGNCDFQPFSIRRDLVHHLAGTHMGPPVLIGVWALFWRVVSPQNRGRTGSR